MNLLNYNNINFGKLQISYDAKEKLENSRIGETYKLRRFGKYLENTREFDFQLDENLNPKIKDNSKLNCVYIEPFNVSISKDNPHIIKLKTTEGIDTENGVINKKQVSLDIYFGKTNEALGVYERILRAPNETERGVLLTKMLDAQRTKDLEHEYFESVKHNREKLIDSVMYLYGNHVNPVE